MFKQALPALFLKLNGCLTKLDFIGSNSDASMKISDKVGVLFVFLIHVDDFLITINNNVFVQNLIDKLNIVFSLKDLGKLNFFPKG